jgi:hypothetical protein
MNVECHGLCCDLSSQLANNFLSKVITWDETWCFQYDPERKPQNFVMEKADRHSPRFRKVRMSKSQMKKVLITYFDIKGIVHFEFIPQGQTVNQAYYLELLKRLREAVRRKRPELWPIDWILHYDNAPAHKALSVKQLLAKKSVTEMEHAPPSPN